MKTISAVKLMDAEVVITGINPAATMTLPETEMKVNGILLFGTLREGIRHASVLQKV
jgi:anti-anti-sigma regulatory factor